MNKNLRDLQIKQALQTIDTIKTVQNLHEKQMQQQLYEELSRFVVQVSASSSREPVEPYVEELKQILLKLRL